jgi:hypothetical protein
VGGEVVAGVVVVKAFGERAVGPVEGHGVEGPIGGGWEYENGVDVLMQ